jgi:hypothetical protein
MGNSRSLSGRPGRAPPLAIMIASIMALPTASAQRADEPRLEARPFIGAYVPTGTQHDVFGTTALVGLQGAVHLPRLILTNTFAWTRSADHRPDGGRDVDLYQIDWGVEKELSTPNFRWRLRPFFGGGVGVRIYDSLERGAQTRRMIVGFAAGGLSRRIGRIDARAELRDHLSRYNGVTFDEASSIRNDITLTLGVARSFR